MTHKISAARANFRESLTQSFVQFRDMLIELGGAHVAIWALFGCNFFFGLYLIVARETLFGSPVKGAFPWPFTEYLWNKVTGSADVALLCLALGLLLGLRLRFVPLIWWASLLSSSIWVAVWVLAWSAFLLRLSELPSICLTGVLPVGFSIFACLRVAADDSDLRPHIDGGDEVGDAK